MYESITLCNSIVFILLYIIISNVYFNSFMNCYLLLYVIVPLRDFLCVVSVSVSLVFFFFLLLFYFLFSLFFFPLTIQLSGWFGSDMCGLLSIRSTRKVGSLHLVSELWFSKIWTYNSSSESIIYMRAYLLVNKKCFVLGWLVYWVIYEFWSRRGTPRCR